MAPVSSRNVQWTEVERSQLWQLRQQHLNLSWKRFNSDLFPHRSLMAVMKAYSDMRIEKGQGRKSLESNLGPNSAGSDSFQDNKRKSSGETTDEQEQQSKRQQMASPSESDDGYRPFPGTSNDGNGAEGPESSDESDTEAGDIPFDNGIAERLSLHRPRDHPRRQSGHTTLAQKEAQNTNDPLTGHNKNGIEANSNVHKKRKETTMGSVQAQSPPSDYIRANSPAPMAPSNQSSEACPSPTKSQGNADIATQHSTTTQSPRQPATEVAPEPSDDPCASLYQTFHQAATIFAQHPQVKARAERAEKENTEKEIYIREMQSSHAAEISYLRDRLALRNELVQEQRVKIEGLQTRLQTIEDEKTDEQVVENYRAFMDNF